MPECSSKSCPAGAKRSERGSDEVEAIISSYVEHHLKAATNNASSVIAVDDLPLDLIKRIMNQDSCDQTAAFVACATQLFIGCMTNLAWQLAAERERNTLGVDDIKAAVRASSRFNYLGDAIDAFDNQQRA